MGGSGGGGYFSRDPREILRDIRAAQETTRSEEYEAACNDLLRSFLVNFNDRDTEAIARHLEEIRGALGDELEGTIDLQFGGSVAKHTYVEGLSDIDSLVMLDNCELADRSPSEAKVYFAGRLRERFPKTEVTEGHLAVTVKFSDAEVQLLPAVSCRAHVKIADPAGKVWSDIRPRDFAAALRDTNQAVAGKVVPTVKLAKAVIAAMPEQQRISGYHAEALAVEVFRGYTGSIQAKDLLRHFFSAASDRVREPILDRTGQSVHVDEYLGAPNSVERRIVSDAFARTARRMANADASANVDEWRRAFGD